MYGGAGGAGGPRYRPLPTIYAQPPPAAASAQQGAVGAGGGLAPNAAGSGAARGGLVPLPLLTLTPPQTSLRRTDATPSSLLSTPSRAGAAASGVAPLRPGTPARMQNEVVFPFYKNPPGARLDVASSSANRDIEEVRAPLMRGEGAPMDHGTGSSIPAAMDEVDDGSRSTSHAGSIKWNSMMIKITVLAALASIGACVALFFVLRRPSSVATTTSTTTLSMPATIPTTTAMPTVDDGYDYIIVGGGTAGMVVAKELSENPALRLLLLEGGGTTNVGTEPDKQKHPDESWGAAAARAGVPEPSIHAVPGEYERLAWGDNYSWYSTFSFQGKGLGGSSAVNKMLYVRPTDTQLASMGWPASMLEPLKAAFKKIESDMPSTHTPSTDGLVYVTNTSDIVGSLLASSSGFRRTHNINDPAIISSGTRSSMFGYPSQITSGGQRANSATAYEPLLRQRPNVDIVMNSEVKRIKIDPQGNAEWVDYITRDITQPDGDKLVQPKLRSNGKVVLTAGALNTPRLLLLSGVGPLSDIQGYGMLINAPQTEWRSNDYVGLDLQDHVQALMGFSKPGVPLFDPRGSQSSLMESRMQWLLNKSGPYAQYGPTLMAYITSPQELSSGSNQPDIQVHTLPHAVSGIASVRYLNDCNMASGNQMCVALPTPPGEVIAEKFQGWAAGSWAMYVTLMKTKSKAKIILDELGRVKYPEVEIGSQLKSGLYLGDPEDVARLKHGITTVFHAMTSGGLGPVAPQLPLSAASIDQAVNSWETSHLIANSWSSSCKIGTCLDQEFRVINTTNIFVADASAIPQVPVQPVGTVMAAAAMAASYIAKAYVAPRALPQVPPLVPEPLTSAQVAAISSFGASLPSSVSQVASSTLAPSATVPPAVGSVPTPVASSTLAPAAVPLVPLSVSLPPSMGAAVSPITASTSMVAPPELGMTQTALAGTTFAPTVSVPDMAQALMGS
eukprot:TRINITY_DN37450_c0_g1_i1.p1 TRINITY_DN37450_c0_g1~~TRINITY_DN37450_c0_g1_i1.p1  ORF type:complete len:957 (-),score=101.82 TRINITY_DN37450_c0_g1_i1:201-3071(-)